MCGIAGFFGSQQIEEPRLETCLALMRRRGPDHAAHRHWINDAGRHAYLLHARLNIIDLDERANQPFHVGSKWIAYNGELYNYLEVRAELRAKDDGGWQALDRCEGMWSFAVYDEADGSLMLSRDRFGEKPLYIYRDKSGLYFGSEV